MWRVYLRRQAALDQFPIKPWTEQSAPRQFRLAARLAGDDRTWASRAIHWKPEEQIAVVNAHIPFRTQGRPKRRWDDLLTELSNTHFPQYDSWVDAATSRQQWPAKEQDFIGCFGH